MPDQTSLGFLWGFRIEEEKNYGFCAGVKKIILKLLTYYLPSLKVSSKYPSQAVYFFSSC